MVHKKQYCIFQIKCINVLWYLMIDQSIGPKFVLFLKFILGLFQFSPSSGRFQPSLGLSSDLFRLLALYHFKEKISIKH